MLRVQARGCPWLSLSLSLSLPLCLSLSVSQLSRWFKCCFIKNSVACASAECVKVSATIIILCLVVRTCQPSAPAR